MKKILVLVLVGLAALAPGGARGDGGGPATVVDGGNGVLSPDARLRYVTLTTGRQTFVAVIRVRDGRVVRWRLVRGFVGIPVVALDGTTGGISRDGSTLVVAGMGEGSRDGGVATRFAVVDTRSLRLRQIKLPGSWSYDAIAPDASTLYLVEYLAPLPYAPYRVRAYDLAGQRLLREAVVDRREAEASMRGRPATRVTSGDGRWAYTLYARARKEPFVHALDTVRREAYCIDLPLEMRLARQMGLRLRLRAKGRELVVHSSGAAAAVIDTESLEVEKS